MMSLVNKLTRTLRLLRWSTIFAILFYMFFIGLILHSTTHKLQHTFKSSHHHQHTHTQPHLKQEQQYKSSSAASGYNALHAPAETSLAATLQNMRSNTIQGVDISNSNSRRDVAVRTDGGIRGVSESAAGDDGGGGAGAVLQKRNLNSVEPETVIFAASTLNAKKILDKAFRRADKNHNSELTIPELAKYINKMIVNHIDEAIDMNPREFRRIDIAPADGLITWEEFHRLFLQEHAMTEDDLDEHGEIKQSPLTRKAREDLIRDRARWSEAARTDLFSLTIDEYLAFRHPESSVSNLLELVDDLLRQFDQDGDDQLTIEEFSEVNMNDDDDLIRKSLISKTVVERRAEFKHIIDVNHDDKADRGELLNYVNPKTPRYALQEAATLFSLCDENKDGKLTLNELVANAEIFLTSKMIDVANSFHTEF